MDSNSRKDKVQKLVRQLASEVYEFIQELAPTVSQNSHRCRIFAQATRSE